MKQKNREYIESLNEELFVINTENIELKSKIKEYQETHKTYRTTILTLLDVVATNHPVYTEDVLRLKKTAI